MIMFKEYYGKSKYAKAVLTITGILFLGAIGTGLWEVIFSHVYESMAHISLNTVGFLFNSYVDYLHKPIGRGSTTDVYGLLPFALIVVSICILPWVLLFAFLRSAKKEKDKITAGNRKDETLLTKEELLADISSFKKIMKSIIIPVAILISVAYALIGFESFYVNRAIRFAERSIEILSPYISSEDILLLRSKYRAVNDAEKFYEFEEMVKKLAKENNIEIPEFESIGKG